ncbi:protein c-Fos [Gadus chalcogrammus]|uniref:protein c-Fos n=1 Tax=Gadus chalcogrammus TaxID=1042646 RepID=UPI0024C47968|nr:protein c-Fos [Gadus chalcogrammus]
MYQGSSPDHDASSSCSGDSPARGGQPPPPGSLSSASSMDSLNQDPDSSDSFVPTVTAISTSPDLRWMVQTTTTSSTHSPSRGGARAKARSKEHTGGKKGKKDQPSKEEDERRKIRRERNKIAAAKCRNRRRELTDTLQAETDVLEEEKAALQTEIADLIKEKARLEQVLASHEPGCEEEGEDEDDDGGDDDDDVSPMQQEPPASPPPTPLLSLGPEGESLSEGPGEGEGGPPLGPPQDLDPPPPPCAAAAILGNSDILLCSSAEEEEEEPQEEEGEEPEPLEDLKVDDLDDLVPSLEMSAPEEEEGVGGGGGVSLGSVGASVPDIDLGGAFGLPDWETLYRSVAQDLEALGTPLVSSSPTCGYRSVFSFSGAEIDSLQAEDDSLALRGPAGGGLGAGGPEFTKDSLNSPTLLAL